MRCWRHFLFALALVALPARAAEGQPIHELSVGVGIFQNLSFFRVFSGAEVVEASYRRPLATEGTGQYVVVGGGLRVGGEYRRFDFERFPLPFELFFHGLLQARLGPWEPALGPEVGLSGLARLLPSIIPSEGRDEAEESRLSPFYLTVRAAPLRFRFDRFSVSALELQVGSSSLFRNTTVRVQLNVLSAGVNL